MVATNAACEITRERYSQRRRAREGEREKESYRCCLWLLEDHAAPTRLEAPLRLVKHSSCAEMSAVTRLQPQTGGRFQRHSECPVRPDLLPREGVSASASASASVSVSE